MIRIFIADDHAIVREGLKQILQEETDVGVQGREREPRDGDAGRREVGTPLPRESGLPAPAGGHDESERPLGEPLDEVEQVPTDGG